MPTKKNRGAPKNNTNAAKPEKNDAHLTLRLSSHEKSAWVKAAHPGKLAEWVRQSLNLAVLRDWVNQGCQLYDAFGNHFRGDSYSIAAFYPGDQPDGFDLLDDDPAQIMADLSDQYGFSWSFNLPAVMPPKCKAMYHAQIDDL